MLTQHPEDEVLVVLVGTAIYQLLPIAQLTDSAFQRWPMSTTMALSLPCMNITVVCTPNIEGVCAEHHVGTCIWMCDYHAASNVQTVNHTE